MKEVRHPPCVTSTTLLDGLRDPANRTIWTAYVERYRPLIVGYVRRLGIAEDEAEDVAQSALLAFASAYRQGRYERDRGRLSSWLFGIVTHEVRAHRRRLRRVELPDADDLLARRPAEDELEALWERRWRALVLRACLHQVGQEVQPTTMAAFRAFALEGRPAREVAASLGLSENAVFGAKRRVLARVCELLPLMEEAW